MGARPQQDPGRRIGGYTAIGAVNGCVAAILFVFLSWVHDNAPFPATPPRGFPAWTAWSIVGIAAVVGGTLGGGLALAEQRRAVLRRPDNSARDRTAGNRTARDRRARGEYAEAKGARWWLLAFVLIILALTMSAWGTGVRMGQRVLREGRVSLVTSMLITRSPHHVSVVRSTPISAPGQEPTRPSQCGTVSSTQAEQVLPTSGWLLGTDSGIATIYIGVGKYEKCVVHLPLSAVILTDKAVPVGKDPSGW